MPSRIRKPLTAEQKLKHAENRKTKRIERKKLADSGDENAIKSIEKEKANFALYNQSLTDEQKRRKKETTKAWFDRRKKAAEEGDELAIASIAEYRERYLPAKKLDGKKRWARIRALASEGDEHSIELIRKSRLNSVKTATRLLAEDIGFRLRHNLRARIRNLMKNGKPNSTTKALGCTKQELIRFIEGKFEPWMNWDNYGIYDPCGPRTWCLDHIIPLSSFDLLDLDQFNKANHFSNLQPLCSAKNLEKSNKLDYEIQSAEA